MINPWHGKSLLSNGKENLSVPEFLSQFNQLILVKGYPSGFVGVEVPINFYSFGIPASNNSEWLRNPQYILNVNKTSPLRILLQSNHEDVYGFTLLRCQAEDVKVIAINLDKLVCTARSSMTNQTSFSG